MTLYGNKVGYVFLETMFSLGRMRVEVYILNGVGLYTNKTNI
jgi:hypothetical protein